MPYPTRRPARQIVGLGQLTDSTPFAGVGLPADQWSPPSVVKMAMAPAFVPPSTATQALEVAQLLALRGVDVSGESWGLQVGPPSVVARMVSEAPTAKPAA